MTAAGVLPTPTLAQLVGAELAAAVVLGGFALRAPWSIAGVALGAVVAVVVLVPVQRRWLYSVAGSWLRSVGRRRAAGAGLAGAVGSYRVESVPGGRTRPVQRVAGGDAAPTGRSTRAAAGPELPTIGVVRSGDVWTVPLLLGLDDVLGADPGVPLAALADLLRVEDVPLADLRLLTVSTPARAPRQAPASPGPAVDQFAARYLLLTVDAHAAPEALASRGGERRAVEQVIRRCVVAAEQAMGNAGIQVRRLDEGAVAGLFAAWLGPAAPSVGRRAPQPVESWRDVRVAGTWSVCVAVAGAAGDVLAPAQRLAAAAPTPIVASALVLRPGRGRAPVAAQVLRFSAPDTATAAENAAAIQSLARGYGLTVRPAGGEQVPLLRLTLPVGGGTRGGDGSATGRLTVTGDEIVPAPPTGVAVGQGEAGTVHLRLFRLAGTRVVFDAGSGLRAAQLLALRAASAGIPVEIVTARPEAWRALIGHGPGSRIRTPDEAGRPAAGPVLLVDDRPGDAAALRPLGDVRAWQCRLEIRVASGPPAAVRSDALESVARADLAVLGAVSSDVAARAVAAFALAPAVGQTLSRLGPGTYALLRRGRVDYVALDPGAAEQPLLAAADAGRSAVSSSR